MSPLGVCVRFCAICYCRTPSTQTRTTKSPFAFESLSVAICVKIRPKHTTRLELKPKSLKTGLLLQGFAFPRDHVTLGCSLRVDLKRLRQPQPTRYCTCLSSLCRLLSFDASNTSSIQQQYGNCCVQHSFAITRALERAVGVHLYLRCDRLHGMSTVCMSHLPFLPSYE